MTLTRTIRTLAKFTAGNDKNNGTPGADKFDGLAGNDTLFGAAGDDILIGSSGHDLLNGGAGNDKLDGGSGNDILIGDSGNDYLDGGDDNDTLSGDTGADTLDGGGGADSLSGGAGNDFYLVDNIRDKVQEMTGSTGGTDTVQSSINFTLSSLLENLTLTGAQNLKGIGNNSSNLIQGNDGNNLLNGKGGIDTLIGGAGSDTLNGGPGSDSLVGGDGSDVYIINNTEDKIVETATDGDTDQVQSSVSYKLIDNLESLLLTGKKAIDGTGNALNNGLVGNKSANQLFGLAGNDTLKGNAGDDVLDGGDGNDILDGGIGNDTAVYAGGVADYRYKFDTTDKSWTVEAKVGGDIDQLTNIEVLRFSDDSIDISAGPPEPTLNVSDIPPLAEGSGGTKTATFTLTLSDIAIQPVTVSYTTVDATALAGSDYTAKQGTVTFNPGELRQTINIPITTDRILEADETFSLRLSNLASASAGTMEASATITNDDFPTLNITGVSQSEGNDPNNANLTLKLSAASTLPVTVNYATANGTATGGSDYTASSGMITIAPGETAKTLAIPVIGDHTVEGNETFKVSLSALTNATFAKTADSSTTVTLINDDQPSLSIADVTLPEGNGGTSNATLTVTLSTKALAPVKVNYSSNNGTASAASDYTAVTGMLIFEPGETSKNFVVPILGDTAPEANETFSITLNTPVNANLDKSSTTVTITNDDLPTVGFVGNVTVMEGNSGTINASLIVNLSTASNQPVTINYATDDDTAIAGSDYTTTSGTLTFAIGEVSKTLTVPVTGDVVVEHNESFSVRLTNPVNAVLSDSASFATVNITNDDQPTLSITDVTLDEGNSGTSNATLTVTLSSAALTQVTVNYSSSDVTAIAGVDYSTVNGMLSFAPGEISKTITVPIIGDNTVEGNGTFTIVLSAPTNATLLTSSATVTLTNDDLPTLSIADLSRPEGNNPDNANLMVTLSAPIPLPVTVAYTTTDGTATAGSDYSATSGTLTFTPNEISKTLPVEIIGDTVNEADETFAITLNTPTNAILTKPSATVTLTNDDQPSLSIANVTITEGNSGTSNANVTVTLSTTALSTVTVNYASSDGTATTANLDYTAINGTFNFAPGETSKTFTVPIVGDNTIESDETFVITLSAPINATLGTSSATVTIANDDWPTVDFAGDVAVTEGDTSTTNAVFTVKLSAAATKTGTVQYTTSNGTATADDYQNTSGTLTFVAGDTSKTITVPVIGDTILESPETVLITLSNPTGGVAIGTTISATVTITDNDAENSLPADNRTYDDEWTGVSQGSANANKMIGTSGHDTMNGGDGNDYLDGANGDDKLLGEGGNDYILGSAGVDTLDGGAGNDSLGGGDGNDKILGQIGDDIIYGGLGNDTIDGGISADVIYGGSGNDRISASEGNDTIYGGEGDDYISIYNGSSSIQSVEGGEGNDTISGGGGYCTVKGGEGNDSISGGSEIYGGNGNDNIGTGSTKLLLGGDGADTITGSISYTDGYIDGEGGNDYIKLTTSSKGLTYGGDGNDTLIGYVTTSTYTTYADTFIGGAGGDTLTGGGAADTFRYENASDSQISSGVDNRDRITDFNTSTGDVIDLSRVDGGTWSFIGTAEFSTSSVSNEIRFKFDAGNTIVSVHGATVDMEIALIGTMILGADDFGLTG